MTSESKVLGRRNTALAAVIGTVLASYAGSAAALEFEFDNGTRVNWNTTLSVGSSWRSEDPSKFLYAYADGSLLGQYSATPQAVGTPQPQGFGSAGNWSAGESALNYEKGDRFSTPVKILSDVEIKKGNYGALLRIKAWYDQALNDEEVAFGHQNNSYNGGRPPLGPNGAGTTPPSCFLGNPASIATCIPLGPAGTNVWPSAKLSDDGFEDEQQFDNLMLLDAYVYGSFEVGDTNLQLRLGNQVVNWGESVFIQGVNQINPIDVPAARRAGAELKEILLPVWMAYANWGFSFGSVEAFYQFEWNNTSVDGCGTYWAVTSSIVSTRAGNCNLATPFGGSVYGFNLGTGLVPQFGSQPFLGANGLYIPLFDGKEAPDSGQFGLAFRFPVDKIDTEIGLYAMNIHSRLPVISSVAGTSLNDLSPTEQATLAALNIARRDANGLPVYCLGTPTSCTLRQATPFQEYVAGLAGIELKSGGSYWEYPEDIQVFGVSTASNIGGWSVSSELSFSKDVPVQINGNDLLLGALALAGPNRAESTTAYLQGTGAYLQGWDQFDKTQFQVNTVKTLSNVLGADNMLLVGEVGMQWNDVPEHKADNVRYGRGFMWGFASSPAWNASPSLAPLQGSTCNPAFAGTALGTWYNPSSRGCRNDGYVTDKAWGYRLRMSADYLNAFNSGVTVTPSLFWSHDVNGVSLDPAFIEDRQVLGLGLKLTYNKKYVLDLNWVDYADEGYDPLQDRDYYSAAVSVTF